MHHLPAGPPSSDRLRRLLTRRNRRVLYALTAGVVAGLLAVATPVFGAGGTSSPVALDASASAGASSVVVMGVDGAPAAGSSAPRASAPLPRTAAAGGTTAQGAAGAGPASRASTGPSGTAATGNPTATATGTGTTPGADTVAPEATSSSPVQPVPAAGASPAPASSGTSSPPTPVSTPNPTSTSSAASGPSARPAAPVDRSSALATALRNARAAAGCDPLAVDDDLGAVAAQHATAMATADALRVPGLGERPALVAQGPTGADAAIAGWLASASASAVLLDCGLTRLGAAEQADGPWWTAVLR